MPVLIFANGDLVNEQWVRPFLESPTAVIAADGGAYHVLAANHVPDIVIGDLDSLDAQTEQELAAQGAHFVRFPVEKDETDLELALLYAAEHFPGEELLVFGVLGGRLDQTLANILLLAHPNLKGVMVRLVEEHQRAWLFREVTTIHGRVGDKLSLIPLGGDAQIQSTQGLKWPLQEDVLSFGPARGVSNLITAVPAEVRLRHGTVLCIHTDGSWER